MTDETKALITELREKMVSMTPEQRHELFLSLQDGYMGAVICGKGALVTGPESIKIIGLHD